MDIVSAAVMKYAECSVIQKVVAPGTYIVNT